MQCAPEATPARKCWKPGFRSRAKTAAWATASNRLWRFLIIDIRGNIIGFGGRVMDDSTPKYLNSPETLIFNKRKNLFALNIARKSKQGRPS